MKRSLVMVLILFFATIDILSANSNKNNEEIYATLITKGGMVIQGTNNGLKLNRNSNEKFEKPNFTSTTKKDIHIYSLIEQKDGKIR